MSASSSDSDAETTRQIERTAAVLSLIYGLMSLCCLMWYLIPAHQRRLLLMTMASNLRQTAQNAAYRAGQREMGREIRGSSPRYQIPYALSKAAACADRIYEKARYT